MGGEDVELRLEEVGFLTLYGPPTEVVWVGLVPGWG